MSLKRIPTRITQKISLVLAICTALLLVTVTIAYATRYNLNTTDNSATDWDPVIVFQSDPSGDVVTATEDIISTKVATGPASGSAAALYFQIKTLSGPALQRQYRAAITYLDCNNNGITGEYDDRYVIYVVSEDTSYVADGYPDSFMFAGTSESDNKTLGERVGSSDTVEWMIRYEDLNALNDCSSGIIRIKFLVGDAHEFYTQPLPPYQVYPKDQTDVLRAYNVPTAIELKQFQARKQLDLPKLAIIASGLIAAFGMGGMKLFRRTKR